MIKSRFNSKLREFAKTLSPTDAERDLVNKIYEAFNNLFGASNCIQIGSYPRFTAVTPVKDLDILYILGKWDENNHSPSAVLNSLYNQINTNFTNPTTYTAKSSLQTHSVTVEFFDGSDVILSVDVVPAYSFGSNEFGQDTYKVPEVIKKNSHKERAEFYKKIQMEHKDMSWITSDPRGYIKVATEVGQNPDFRKTVKFIKVWKNNLRNEDEILKLKSFHIEQVITKLFQKNPNIEIFDAIFSFFFDLPEIIDNPNQIADRANANKYVDDYLVEFTSDQKDKIRHARDGYLIQFESIKDSDSIDLLLKILFYQRPNDEEFLFDNKMVSFLDPQYSDFALTADITDKQGNVQRRLNSQGMIDSGRYLKFNKTKNIDGCIYHWKVKNDNKCGQPRGEITPHQTKNVPENTKYKGTHYVECYAIKGDICIATARHYVVIG